MDSLKSIYAEALEDIDGKMKDFYKKMMAIQLDIDFTETFGGTPEEIEQMKSRMQSKVWQVQYQQQLQKQLEEGIKIIESGTYEEVHDYLNNCYTDGFVGAMYSMHNDGIPLLVPIDQKAMTKAVILDSKISKGLYSKIVSDVAKLKKQISVEVSRGIAIGATYEEMKRNLHNVSGIGLRRAGTIVRTEGHRILQISADDARHKAQEAGADVVKQWDATLDGKTRKSHRKVDGQIRELDEPFSNGLMYAGDPKGKPEEVINCRCATLQRARWALDDSELEALRKRASKHGLQVDDSKKFGKSKAKDFSDFKKKYLKALENDGKSDIIIPKEKFEQYALNPQKSPDKAKAFEMALGYTLADAEELSKKIRDNFDEKKLVEKGDSGYGMRYEYIMDIEGKNGKHANVLTAWIRDKETGKIRMTSAYITKKKVKDDGENV